MRALYCGLLVAVMAPLAASAADVEFAHSGRLVDSVGNPVNGEISLQVRLFTQTTPQDPQLQMWEDTFDLSHMSDGYFSLILGSGEPLPSSVFDAQAVFVEHQVVGQDPLTPRQMLYRVPAAEVAHRVRTSAALSTSCDDTGALFFNTATNLLMVCNGSTWQATGTPGLAGTGTQPDCTTPGQLWYTEEGFEGCTNTGWVALDTTVPPPPSNTVQLGPEGKDTYIGSVYNNDYSDRENLTIGGWGDTYYMMIEFDLSSFSASPATSATLRLFPFYTRSAPSYTVHAITSSWDENASWSGPSADQIGSMPAATQGEWVEIDITSTFNAWRSGEANNHGIQLRPNGTSNNFIQFSSGESTEDPSLRPQLVVTYD